MKQSSLVQLMHQYYRRFKVQTDILTLALNHWVNDGELAYPLQWTLWRRLRKDFCVEPFYLCRGDIIKIWCSVGKPFRVSGLLTPWTAEVNHWKGIDMPKYLPTSNTSPKCIRWEKRVKQVMLSNSFARNLEFLKDLRLMAPRSRPNRTPLSWNKYAIMTLSITSRKLTYIIRIHVNVSFVNYEENGSESWYENVSQKIFGITAYVGSLRFHLRHTPLPVQCMGTSPLQPILKKHHIFRNT